MADPVFVKKGDCIVKKELGGRKFLLKIRSGHLECISTVLEEGTETKPFAHEGEEIKIAIQGEIDYHVGDKVFHLTEGDVLWHEGGELHRAVNVGKGVARYLAVGPILRFDGI